MTNLGLKTLNVVLCYYHHMLPKMWEALNTTSLSICSTMCKSGHLLALSISNILSCYKPPTTYWFLNLGNEINVTGANQSHCDIPSHFSFGIRCVYKRTDGSVMAGSSAARAVKSVSECRMREVTRVEQRSYIKIAILRGENAMEYLSELVEALGNIMPYHTVQ
ncbi:uncharacterized protein TNCV_586401 [Trichonephila clavipes]|nr:uncharacterized protein TNCV_586401 [Trichonephila clavipes]